MHERESLYRKYQDYHVDLADNPARVRVMFNGEVIADSVHTVVVRETKHAPVVYFPRRHVRFDFLEPTSHATFCPFKGAASYWTLRVGERVEENAVWGYEDPFQEVSGLKELVAFYPDRVDWVQS